MEPEINKQGKVTGFKKTIKKAIQKVHYSKLSEPVQMSCSDKKHNWFIPDVHNHTASCRNCKQKRFIRAIFERVKDGKILDRDTGEQIY